MALTTIVASAATAPFEIYHFNRLTIYGLAANLGAMPVTALWVMPWGILALILMPVGLEELALVPMGWGTAVVITVAETVSSWPGAVRPWPAVSIVALALCGIGGLWLCLWRKAWRWCGLGGIAAGIACAVFPPPPPDVIVDGQARLFAVGVENGGVMLSTHKAARFITEVWLRRVGQSEAESWPGSSEALRCDSLGCIYRANGKTVALVQDPRALAEDCLNADIVVSLVPVWGRCPSAEVTIDRFDIWRCGSHALWIGDGEVEIPNIVAKQGLRPWSRFGSRLPAGRGKASCSMEWPKSAAREGYRGS